MSVARAVWAVRGWGAAFVLAAAALYPLAAAHGAETQFGRYRALVIGINDYQNLPRLETAVNDASAVHDLLRRQYGFDSHLMLNPTRYELVRALDELRADLTEQDNLLIYYAGHGVLDAATDEGFWLPVDAEEDSQANWLAVPTVTRTLRAIAAKHVLVVADSCYSGTLTREAPAALATARDRLTELHRLAAKRARKALTSGGFEPVYDGGGDGHSVFTRALLEALRENQEVLDGYQLYTKLRHQVVLNAEQTPRYADVRLAGDEGGDFLFVPVSASVRATPEEAPAPASSLEFDARQLELVFWDSIKDSAAPADFEAYLAQFPDGTYAVLARNRLQRLREGAAEPPPPEAPAATPPEVDRPEPVELAFWTSVREADSTAAYGAYLERFPDGDFAPLARLRLHELEPPPAPEPPAETEVAVATPQAPALDAGSLGVGTAVRYDSWAYRITAKSGGTLDIDFDGRRQRLLYGLVRVGWEAVQTDHELTISDKNIRALSQLFPLRIGGAASFKMVDKFSEGGAFHRDHVKVRLEVIDRAEVEFDGYAYPAWIIAEELKLSSSRISNASVIQRRIVYSEALGIALRVREDTENYSASWDIIDHGDYALSSID